VPRADAFRRLADRTGLEELRSLSAILNETEMFGTSIARALRVHSASLRVRRTYRAEERAATVSVKMMLPLVLCILPALAAVILGPVVAGLAEYGAPPTAHHFLTGHPLRREISIARSILPRSFFPPDMRRG
jgi:tight adherence protein C